MIHLSTTFHNRVRMLDIPPGLIFIASTLPALLSPAFLTCVLLSLLHGFTPFRFPHGPQTILCILSIPGALTLQVPYNDYVNAATPQPTERLSHLNWSRASATAKKKKSYRPAAIHAKNSAQLRSKKLDLEFSVDPLFEKTCADFDNGGTQGLLMSHLSLGTGSEAGLRLIFDASDSVGSFLPVIAVLKDKEIAHSLPDFPFLTVNGGGSDDTTFSQDNTQQLDNGADDDDKDNDTGPADYFMNVYENASPVEDFFVGDDAVADDYGADSMGGDDYGGENQSHGSGIARHGSGPPRRHDTIQPSATP
ncbi:hypothetical protein B0H19DRAFT_1266625 [Mycena capillaripes]|nr:hypothetical protein B0H19DRAFT_1266625 [Mycena capillaripes]